jgi:cytohesin
MLLRNGATLDVKDDNGLTPLHRASLFGEIDCVNLLLSEQANINTTSKDGNTPLLSAIFNGFTALAEVLIESGASLTKANNENMTPLHAAIKIGDANLVQLLLAKQPSTVNSRTIRLATPLRNVFSLCNLPFIRYGMPYRGHKYCRIASNPKSRRQRL